MEWVANGVALAALIVAGVVAWRTERRIAAEANTRADEDAREAKERAEEDTRRDQEVELLARQVQELEEQRRDQLRAKIHARYHETRETTYKTVSYTVVRLPHRARSSTERPRVRG